MEDRTRRRRWSGRNDGDTGWVEHRVAKTSGKLFIQKYTTVLSLTYICPLKRERRCGSEGMRRDGYTRIRSVISRYFPPSVRGFVYGR